MSLNFVNHREHSEHILTTESTKSTEKGTGEGFEPIPSPFLYVFHVIFVVKKSRLAGRNFGIGLVFLCLQLSYEHREFESDIGLCHRRFVGFDFFGAGGHGDRGGQCPFGRKCQCIKHFGCD